MTTRLLNILKTFLASDLLLPILLLLSYIIFLIVARGVVPTSSELISDFQALYQKYGYEIIFVGAFLESLVVINLFVPGVLAITLGIIFARTGHTSLSLVILTAASAEILGCILDFVLGKFGFADVINRLGYGQFLKKTEAEISKFGKKGYFLGFFHPDFASFLSLTLGTTRMNFLNFLKIAIPSVIFWSVFWSMVVYWAGGFILGLITRYAYLLILLTIAFMIISSVWKKRQVT